MRLRLASPSFEAFHYPLFRLYWAGQCATNVAAWMQIVATGWLVLELTDSPAYLGLNAGLQAVPLLVFSLVGGVIADRYDRYRLMLIAQVAILVPDSVLAVLVGTGLVRVEHIFACSVLNTALSAMANPARQSYLPRLVPPEALLSAVSLSGVLWHGSAVLGPTLAGLIMVVWGLPANFYVTVVGGLVCLVTLLLIRVPAPPPPAATTSPWHTLAEGLRYA